MSLFIALFMLRPFDIGWYLFIGGLLFCIAVATWLVLPDSGYFVAFTTGALHWVSLLVLMVLSFIPSQQDSGPSDIFFCLVVGLFHLLGAIGIMIPVSPWVEGAIAVVFGAATFILAWKQRVVTPFEGEDGDELAGENKQLDSDEYIRARLAPYNLTSREMDILLSLAEGNSLKRVADELFLAENTVKRHRTNVYRKLGVNSRQELIDLIRAENKRR